jgi:ribose transport system permease protein
MNRDANDIDSSGWQSDSLRRTWPAKQEAGGILIALVLLCAAVAVVSPNFLNSYNLIVVTREASFVGLIALGETLVLLLGGIDLSVGAGAGLCAILSALTLTQFGVPAIVALLASAAFGFAFGAANGFFIAVMRLNPFIVTLASWQVFAGMTLVITHGYPVQPLGAEFHWYGAGSLFGAPIPVVAFLALALVLSWILRSLRFGRNISAIGGSREAAKLVGIGDVRVEVIVYGLAGAFAGLAGALYASRMDSAQPAVGEGWLMGAITAAIIGGTSLQGGQGTILGTVLGTLLMAVLNNAMALLNVSGYWTKVVIGAVVLVAVLVDLLRRR